MQKRRGHPWITAIAVVLWSFDIARSPASCSGCEPGQLVMRLMTAVRANVEGKRVAWANLLLRTAGMVGGLSCWLPFTTLVSWTAASLPHQIANAHTLFNVLLGFVALPFLPWGVALARWLVPESTPCREHDKSPCPLSRRGSIRDAVPGLCSR